jgi:endonuclease YncB( thermonuclease family)
VSTVRTLVVWGLLLHAGQILAETIEGRVVGIADGDTITVLDGARTQHKVRLAGIDAPEKAQAFGAKSKASLARMVFSQNVTLDCRKFDRYRRELCVVFADGQDVNLEQIRGGMAWWYQKYQREQTPAERTAYEQAQLSAQAHRLGLWADENPTPPWDFRHPR